MSANVKIVVTVPQIHTEKVLKAMGNAGAGSLGNYKNCSFVISGTGRFLPLPGATPTIGKVGKLEKVPEDRIEMICLRKKGKEVIKAMKKAHPYEDPAYDIYSLLSEEEL